MLRWLGHPLKPPAETRKSASILWTNAVNAAVHSGRRIAFNRDEWAAVGVEQFDQFGEVAILPSLIS
jgi:hypothetical protein